MGPQITFAFESGNVLRSGCGYLSSPFFDRIRYDVTGAPPHPVVVHDGAAGPIFGYEDGSLFVGGTSPEGGRCLREHSGRVTAIETSERSTMISGSLTGEIAMWSLGDWSFKGYAKVGKPGVSCLSLNRRTNVRIFASGQTDGSVAVWTLEGAQLSSFYASGQAIDCLAIFPNSSGWLAVATQGSVSVWNYHTRRHVADLPLENKTPITALHVSQESVFYRNDPIVVVAGLSDGRGILWELDAT